MDDLFVIFIPQASFLPETIGVALPETIPEASVFGRQQKYFSWIRKPREIPQKQDQVYKQIQTNHLCKAVSFFFLIGKLSSF